MREYKIYKNENYQGCKNYLILIFGLWDKDITLLE